MNSGTLQLDSQRRQNRWYCDTCVPAQGVTLKALEGEMVATSPCKKYMLWIDGVGAWQLCVGESFIVGAPSFEKKSADIALLANISRIHASIKRNSEEWRLTAHQPTTVSGRTVEQDTVLRSGDEIRLAERVRLGFRIPSILSTSAVIDFESDHRPSHSVDGIILLADHCLLGPRRDHHIRCTHWPDVVVLFLNEGKLRCRSKAALSVDGQVAADSIELKHGCVVTGEELRFRVEQME
ncbi:MAG: FHA domain-containing protein [Fuerstiella sp.]